MGNIFQNMGKESHAQKYFSLAESIAREIDGSVTSSELPEKPNDIELPLLYSSMGSTSIFEVGSGSFNLQCVSEKPLIFKIQNFVSDEECSHIIARANDKLQRSYVMGSHGHEANQSSYRDSLNTWLSVDETLNSIQNRIFLL